MSGRWRRTQPVYCYESQCQRPVLQAYECSLPECALMESVVARESDQTTVGNRQDEEDLIGSIVPDASVGQSTQIRFHVEVDPSGHARQRPATYAKNKKDDVRKQRCKIDDLDDQRNVREC